MTDRDEPETAEAEGTADVVVPGPWYRPPEPYEPGNMAALKHGAWSPRRVDPLAVEILEGAIGEGLPSWWAPTDWPAVWAWARTEARVQLLSEYLASFGELGDVIQTGERAGKVRPAAKLLTDLESSAARRRAELGLTPASRAKLSRDTAAAQVDVAALFERLAKAEAAKVSEGGGTADA